MRNIAMRGALVLVLCPLPGCMTGASDVLGLASTGLSSAQLGRGNEIARVGVPLLRQGAQMAATAERRERQRAAAEAERRRVAALERTPAGRRQLVRERTERERNARRNAELLGRVGAAILSGGTAPSGQEGSACGPTISDAQCDYAIDRQFATGSMAH